MKFYTRQRRMPTVIIVSLIDIFAILLIFVIVTTTFKRVQPEVRILLPEAASGKPSGEAAPSVVVTVSQDNRVYVGGEEVAEGDLAGFLQRLAGREPGRRVSLRADKQAQFQTILRVMEALKAAGIEGGVSAAVEQPK